MEWYNMGRMGQDRTGWDGTQQTSGVHMNMCWGGTGKDGRGKGQVERTM